MLHNYVSTFWGTDHSLRINDDTTGGNDISPFLSNYDDQTYFIAWEDEVKTSAQFISKIGEKIGDAFTVDYKTFEFYEDGKAIAYWEKKDSQQEYQVGYTIYDQSWNEVISDTLGTIENSWYTNILAEKNNNKLVIIYKDNHTLYATIVYSDASVIQKQISPSDYTFYHIDLFVDKDSQIWIKYEKYLKCLDENLEEISTVSEMPYNSTYIGEQKYARISWYDSYPFNDVLYYLEIITPDDSLIVREHLDLNIDNIKLSKMSNNSIMITYRKGNVLLNKIFNLDGVQINQGFEFISVKSGSQKDFTVSQNGDQFFFAWADSRNSGLGYDIYGSVHNVDDVITSAEEVEVSRFPADYNLSQNYPNPFNPTTTIEYTVPADPLPLPEEFAPIHRGDRDGLVTLKVYDILGREVATLVNELQKPGIYVVEFNGDNFPSGVYFYSITAGSYSNTRKMLLLK